MASITGSTSRQGQAATQVQDAGTATARPYTNHLAVRTSLAEVLLDFGQHYPPSGTLVPVSTLVTSPVHLMLFQEQLTGALARYEAEYGALPVLPRTPSQELGS
jgi:hypothetical protein